MIYSKACGYAVRALTHLVNQVDEPLTTRQIAQAEGIPRYYLVKILQDLARQGILTSTKGPGGGFKLALPADAVTLYGIVIAIDGPADLYRCALGYDDCRDQQPCGLHDAYRPIRDQIIRYLETTDLAQMAEAVQGKRHLASLNGDESNWSYDTAAGSTFDSAFRARAIP